MKLAFSATNPCHLYDMAVPLFRQGALGAYYSGYPTWKLRPPAGFPIRAHSFRTLVTYGALRLPARCRPADHRLFRWQDGGFDRAVAGDLARADAGMIHAMPGQALATFRAARTAGIGTVLNHASGPIRQQLDMVAEEYRREGIPQKLHHGFDDRYFAREEQEYTLADRHCVASSIVRRQLIQAGVAADRIWTVPYGADETRFHPPPAGMQRDPGRVVFAGQISLRKGLRILWAAMPTVREASPATLELYGRVSSEMQPAVARLADEPWLRLRGPVSQEQLGAVFRRASVLVLPSWEEAFGLVVVQALACNLPCIVSDRVGAGDLIAHRQNGSIVPVGDAAALATEIAWWLRHPEAFRARRYPWEDVAGLLLRLTGNFRPS